MMNCPKCKDTPIHEMRIEGVDVDLCSSCLGIWFDKDELAFMAELPVDVPNFSVLRDAARPTEYLCPRCGEKLEEICFMEVEDLLIDRCPTCQGIWLDKGELPKIEKVAARLGDAKSKIMLAGKQLHQKGYQILGIQTE